MAAPNWSKLPPLIEDLLAHAPEYGLFQAIAVVERAWGSRGRIGNGLDRWLRVEPHPGLAFPPADLRGGHLDASGVLRLKANVDGLYGVDAPVPHYLLEAAARQDEIGVRFRAFLDLFNHRLYGLLYQAWKLRMPTDGEGESPYAGLTRALVGGSGEAGLRYAGRLGRRRPSAAALAAILEAELALPVRVVHGQPQWLAVEGQPALGAQPGPRLGEDTLLGEGVQVAGERIDLHIGPLLLDQALDLLPGRQDGARLLALLGDLLGPDVPFDLVLRVAPGDATAPALGSGPLPLGWSAWLGERLDAEVPLRVSTGRLPTRPPPSPAMPAGKRSSHARTS